MEVLLWTLHYNLKNVFTYPVDSLMHMKALHMMEMHIILPYQMPGQERKKDDPL